MRIVLTVLVFLCSQQSFSQRIPESALSGTYAFDNGMTIQVTEKNGKIFLITAGSPLQELIHGGNNHYQSATIKGDDFHFTLGMQDSIKLVVTNGQGKLRAAKISNEVDDFTASMDSLLTLRKKSEHFDFWYSPTDTGIIGSVRANLEKDYEKILKDFGLKGLPVTTVKIYPDLQSFHYAINFPTAPPEVLATAFGKDEFRMVSPTKGGGDMTKFIAHEFTHCVHLNIDYSPNNPRWLWEGLAMYESGWFMDPSAIDEITTKNYPQLATLGNGMEYSLGYVIIEAITNLYGFGKVIDLVKNQGNVQKVFAVSDEAFQKAIFDHIHDKYVK